MSIEHERTAKILRKGIKQITKQRKELLNQQREYKIALSEMKERGEIK